MHLKLDQMLLNWSPRWIYQLALPLVVCETSSSSTSLPATWDFKTLSLASLMESKWGFITSNSQHFFKLLLTICHYGDCLIMTFAHFPIELFFFFPFAL